jgi:hypothetical protein
MEEFIDDIRNLQKLDDFENGKDKQRDHLNKVVAAFNGIKDAADRAAASGAFKTFEGYVVDGGVSTLYTLFGSPKA